MIVRIGYAVNEARAFRALFRRMFAANLCQARLVILALIPLCLAACSNPAGQPSFTADGPGKPALWTIRENGGEDISGYIFGTVHLLPPGAHWRGPKIDDAAAKSRSLVTEVRGLDDAAALTKIFTIMGQHQNLPPLERRVSPGLADELRMARGNGGAIRDTTETWAAALIISSRISDQLGLKSQLAPERILQSRFAALDKPHMELESIAQQFGYFDGLPEADQRLLLAAVLRGVPNAHKDTQKMLDHWRGGNADALLLDAGKGALASPNLREILLDRRNRRWTEQLIPIIEKGRIPFIAVGAAHVAGPGGLPALLRAKGYRVERVQ